MQTGKVRVNSQKLARPPPALRARVGGRRGASARPRSSCPSVASSLLPQGPRAREAVSAGGGHPQSARSSRCPGVSDGRYGTRSRRVGTLVPLQPVSRLNQWGHVHRTKADAISYVNTNMGELHKDMRPKRAFRQRNGVSEGLARQRGSGWGRKS